ncbi:hypothetical protein KBC54_03430 [Patescibacteria group bacterium]|nr:hypothetical protein [Patescibacteria group bacterium]
MKNPFEAPRLDAKPARAQARRQAVADVLHEDAEAQLEERLEGINVDWAQRVSEALDDLINERYFGTLVYVIRLLKESAPHPEKHLDLIVDVLRNNHINLFCILDCFSERYFPGRSLVLDLLKEYARSEPTACLRLLSDYGAILPPEERVKCKQQLEVGALVFAEAQIQKIPLYLSEVNFSYNSALEDPIANIEKFYRELGREWHWSEHEDLMDKAIRISITSGDVGYAKSIVRQSFSSSVREVAQLGEEEKVNDRNSAEWRRGEKRRRQKEKRIELFESKFRRMYGEEIEEHFLKIIRCHQRLSHLTFFDAVTRYEDECGCKISEIMIGALHGDICAAYESALHEMNIASFDQLKHRFPTFPIIEIKKEIQRLYSRMLRSSPEKIEGWVEATGVSLDLSAKDTLEAVQLRCSCWARLSPGQVLDDIRIFQGLGLSNDIQESIEIYHLHELKGGHYSAGSLVGLLGSKQISFVPGTKRHEELLIALIASDATVLDLQYQTNSFSGVLYWVADQLILHKNVDLNVGGKKEVVDAFIRKNGIEIANQVCLARCHVGKLIEWCEVNKVQPDVKHITERMRRLITNRSVDFQGLFELSDAFQVTFELDIATISSIRGPLPLRDAARLYKGFLPKKGEDRLKAIQALRKQSTSMSMLPELLEIRGPARREEFCPYKQQIEPLLRTIGFLEAPVDQRAIIQYFKEFGMLNLPYLANTIIDVNRVQEITSEDERLRKIEQSPKLKSAMELLRIQSTELTPEHLIKRIKEFQKVLAHAVLNDQPLPVGVEYNEFAMSIFNALIPHVGTYAGIQDRPTLVSLLRSQEQRKPPIFLTHQTMQVFVRKTEEIGEDAESMREQPVEKKIALLDEQIAKKIEVEPLQNFFAPWRAGMRLEQFGQSDAGWWLEGIHQRLLNQKKELETKLESITNEKGKIAIQKQLQVLEQYIDQLDVTHLQNSLDAVSAKDAKMQAKTTTALLFQGIRSIFKSADGKTNDSAMMQFAGVEAHALAMRLMRIEAPGHIESIEQAEREHSTTAKFTAWKKYFFEEYLEHFQREGASQCPEELREVLHMLWRTKGIASALRETGMEKYGAPKHPLGDVVRAVSVLEKQRELILNGLDDFTPTNMEIHPVKGIGHALSGDIANACFNKHRQALIKGEFSGITSLLLALPEQQTELAGSVLCIDTRTSDGKRVLVIRALNPTESVVQRVVYPTSVVRAVVEYVIQAAEASHETDPNDPVREVRLCVSPSGQHSTNRPVIAAAEQKLLTTVWKDHKNGSALENTSETTFNTYHIWIEGQTKTVWEK